MLVKAVVADNIDLRVLPRGQRTGRRPPRTTRPLIQCHPNAALSVVLILRRELVDKPNERERLVPLLLQLSQ